MNPQSSIAALMANAAALTALVRAMPTEGAHWKPSPEDWSTVEVVNHLADEECEDFRIRLDFVLHRPGETPPPNEPDLWVTARAYNTRDLDASLARFLTAREESLAWLRELDAPDWSRAWTHPSGGSLRAGDLLVSWAAHDLLHLRQLVEIQYHYRAREAAPYDVAYAGDW